MTQRDMMRELVRRLGQDEEAEAATKTPHE